jgi:hypothetical protein
MPADPALSPSFAELATAPCPPYGPMLVAVQGELGPVDAEAVDARLDALALGLFGLAGLSPAGRARALAETLDGALAPTHAGPQALLIGEALEARAAHPLLRAAVGAELARRAGLVGWVASSRGRWLMGAGDEPADAAAAVDPLPIPQLEGIMEAAGRPGSFARSSHPLAIDCGADPAAEAGVFLCGHELAFAALSRLAPALESAGRHAAARRAAGLRLLLPLDADLRARVRRELAHYGGGR